MIGTELEKGGLVEIWPTTLWMVYFYFWVWFSSSVPEMISQCHFQPQKNTLSSTCEAAVTLNLGRRMQPRASYTSIVIETKAVAIPTAGYEQLPVVIRSSTTSHQSNLRRARRCCRTIHHSPHWLQWDAPNSPQNCPFHFDDHHPI